MRERGRFTFCQLCKALHTEVPDKLAPSFPSLPRKFGPQRIDAWEVVQLAFSSIPIGSQVVLSITCIHRGGHDKQIITPAPRKSWLFQKTGKRDFQLQEVSTNAPCGGAVEQAAASKALIWRMNIMWERRVWKALSRVQFRRGGRGARRLVRRQGRGCLFACLFVLFYPFRETWIHTSRSEGLEQRETEERVYQ